MAASEMESVMEVGRRRLARYWFAKSSRSEASETVANELRDFLKDLRVSCVSREKREELLLGWGGRGPQRELCGPRH